MATAKLPVVGEIVAIPLSEIRVRDRLRPIDPVWAAALGRIMDVEKQRTPIEVCRLPGKKDFLLVAGGHRLEGARLNGWDAVQAVIVDASALVRRSREVSENLFRRDLSPIDRAAFIAELICLAKTRAGVETGADGRSVSAAARWSKALKSDAVDANLTMRLAYGWADGVAEQIGLSRQTIYRDLALHSRLAADLAEQLRGHPIAGNGAQLAALIKLSPDDQRQAVDLIIQGHAKTVAQAVKVLRQPPREFDPAEKAYLKNLSAFVGAFGRMSNADRKLALGELGNLLPKGIVISFGDEPS